MNLNPIHQTPEERLALSSKGAVEATQKNGEKLDEVKAEISALREVTQNIGLASLQDEKELKAQEQTNKKLDELKDYIDHPEVVVQKLGEIKSASLIANKLLKDISKKEMPIPEKYPTKMKVELEGAELVTIKGEKGAKGDKGDKGDRGEKGDSIKGEKGERGEKGIQGVRGLQGDVGKRGATGEKGQDGIDGKDGSPDTPEQVLNKLNQAEGKILHSQVLGLPELMDEVARYGTNPVGKGENVGGANPLIFQSAGTRIGDYVTTLNVTGSGGTLAYSGDGVATLNLTGGTNSPLTTKGDLYGFDTGNQRIPVGADGTVLTADSTQALGVKWSAAAGGQTSIQFQDEGGNLGATGTADTVNFVGAGVTASRAANTVTVTIAGGGGTVPSYARTLMVMGA
jgi:hypothetical protein